MCFEVSFYGGGQDCRGLNPEPYMYYALSQPIELNSRGHTLYSTNLTKIFYKINLFKIKF